MRVQGWVVVLGNGKIASTSDAFGPTMDVYLQEKDAHRAARLIHAEQSPEVRLAHIEVVATISGGPKS